MAGVVSGLKAHVAFTTADLGELLALPLQGPPNDTLWRSWGGGIVHNGSVEGESGGWASVLWDGNTTLGQHWVNTRAPSPVSKEEYR